MKNLFYFTLGIATLSLGLLFTQTLSTAENRKNEPLEGQSEQPPSGSLSAIVRTKENNESRHLSELPIHEQLAHKSLMKKLKLIRIHQDYIFRQGKAILKLMKVLEKEKDKDGNINTERLIQILDATDFPELQLMKPELEAMCNDSYLGYKAKYCLEVLSQDKKDVVYKWFEILEKEILVEINTYEDAGMSFPQYRYILEMYTDAKESLKYKCQLMMLMSPKLFNTPHIDNQ